MWRGKQGKDWESGGEPGSEFAENQAVNQPWKRSETRRKLGGNNYDTLLKGRGKEIKPQRGSVSPLRF